MKCLVIDTETTGLDPNKNQMIQLGAIVYEDGKEKDTFSLSVTYNGEGMVEPAAFKKNKTGMAGYMFASLIVESSVIYKFCDFVLNNPCDYLVGFNVQFDLAFLRTAFERAKVNFVNFLPYKVIDPFILAQTMALTGHLPSSIKTNLSALCKHYGMETEGAHEALQDIRMTYGLMVRMMNQIRVG